MLSVHISHVQFSTQKLGELRRETKNDNKLQSLLEMIADGCPDRQRELHPQLRAFWHYRDELVAHDSILLNANQIVMPASVRAETLTKLQESHQGIDKTCLRARSCVFWNANNQDIEDVVRVSVQDANKCSLPNNVSRSCLTTPRRRRRKKNMNLLGYTYQNIQWWL